MPTISRAERRPMALRLDYCPWQALPDMSASPAAARAGIAASLTLIEIHHHHAARRTKDNNRPSCAAHLRAALAAALARASVTEATR